MATATATLDLAVPADEVWQLIGGFGSLPEWVSGITQTQLADGGRVRHLHGAKGTAFIERLETYDRAQRSYSYSIVASPVSVTDYLSTLTVTPTQNGTASHVAWTARFAPVSIAEAEAVSIFTDLFTAGLHSLATWFANGRQTPPQKK